MESSQEDLEKQVRNLFWQDYSRTEIANKIGVPLSVVKRVLSNLGLKYSKEQISKINSRQMKKQYQEGKRKALKGKDNPSSRPEIKEKIKKYNFEHKEELKRKREATCLKRYGVKNVFLSKEFQNKIKQTNLKKYGYDSPMKNKSVSEKTGRTLKKTLAKKYDFEGRKQRIISESERLGRKLKASELIKVSGVVQANAYVFMHNNDLEKYVDLKTVEIEEEVCALLDGYGIKYEKHNREIIKPREIDIYIPEYKVGIEVNDLATHNSTYCAYKGGNPKPKEYHYDKTMKCQEKEVRLIHIWDYEWYDERKRPILESIILSACGQVKSIGARKCVLKEVGSSEMAEFFNNNHIAGHRGGKIAINLEYNGEVVMSYIFGKAFLSRGKYEWEIIRATTKRGCRVVGGASKIWKHFIEKYDPKSCVFYVDTDYFDGSSLNRLGFQPKRHNLTPKNYLVKEGRIIGRNPKRHKEIKEMLEKGEVWQFWTSGSSTYTWEKGWF